MTIQEQTKALLEKRKQINGIMETLTILKSEKDSMQRKLMEDMAGLGFNSVKIEDTTVSKAIKKTIKITNEEELIKELDSRGIKNEYVREQVDKDLWKGLSAQLAKEGKIFGGTELSETEYISIRTNKLKK